MVGFKWINWRLKKWDLINMIRSHFLCLKSTSMFSYICDAYTNRICYIISYIYLINLFNKINTFSFQHLSFYTRTSFNTTFRSPMTGGNQVNVRWTQSIELHNDARLKINKCFKNFLIIFYIWRNHILHYYVSWFVLLI